MFEREEIGYDEVSVALLRDASSPGTYRVQLLVGGFGRVASPEIARIVSSEIELDWTAVRANVRNVRFTREASPMATEELRALGLWVYDTLFQGEVRHVFLNALASSRNLRIHWDGDPEDPRSEVLPWEFLFVPTAPVSFLALTRKYSLTRRNAAARATPIRPMMGPLRMLFVSAAPRAMPPLPGVDQEIAIIVEVTGASHGKVDLEVITDANIDKVLTRLREFRPHLFHFSGHSIFNEDMESGQLVFQDDAGDVRLVKAEELAILLHDYDVFLAVLNGCDTGVSSTNDAVSSIAGALIKAGVPAVVATMREVQDQAAMRFTREFYRSFSAGFTVEACIAEARKALSFDNWHWSAYALFVGSVDLDSLRILAQFRSDGS